MSHWQAAVEQVFPRLAKALDSIGLVIGNRPIDVYDAVLVAEPEDVEGVRAVVRGAFEDVREALDAFNDSPAGRTEALEFGTRLGVVLAGCVQLGVWLGEGGQATLDPNRVRWRMALLDKEGRRA